jgi:CHAT domain-containing protein/TolA-binding protein
MDVTDKIAGVLTTRALKIAAIAILALFLLFSDEKHNAVEHEFDRIEAEAERFFSKGMELFAGQKSESRARAAIAEWEKAAQLFDKTGSLKAADARASMGAALYFLGNYKEAVELHDQALTLYSASGDIEGEAISLIGKSSALLSLGNLHGAAEAARRCVAIRRKIGDSRKLADGLYSAGRVLSDAGELEEALDMLLEAHKTYAELGERGREANALCAAGKAYFLLGLPEKGFEFCLEGVGAGEAAGINPDIIGDILGSLGVMAHSIGNADRALTFHEKSLSIRKEQGDTTGVAGTLLNMAAIHRQKKDYKRAEEMYEEALSICRKTGRFQCVEQANGGLGFLYLDVKKYIEAVARFDAAMSEAADSKYKWQWLFGAGEARRGAGERDLAAKAFAAAIDRIEGERAKLMSEAFDVSFMSDRLFVYEEMILLLIEMGRATDAFNYTERMRGMSFRDLLERGKMGVRESDCSGAAPPGRTDTCEKSWRGRRAGSASAIDAVRLLEMTREDDVSILEYFVGANGAALFVASDGKLDVFVLEASEIEGEEGRPLNADILERRVETFLSTMGARSLSDDSKEIFRTHVSLGQALFRELLGQANEKGLIRNGERLLIIPDGALAFLPFETLIVGAEARNDYTIQQADYSSLNYLAEANPIFYAPSATVFDILRDRKREVRDSLRVKPSFVSGGDYAQGLIPARLAAFGDPLLPAAGYRADMPGYQATLRPLPHSRKEVENVGKMFAVSDIFVGGSATEENARRIMRDYDVIYFATHGVLEPADSLSSGLLFSEVVDPSHAGDTKADGLLTAREILADPDIVLNSSFVVLSACNTGIGRLHKGEGVFGLPRAFLIAGASSVAVSLWGVEDESAAKLMERFFAEIANGASAPDALRSARISVRAEHPQPFFWAPFILIGEPSLRLE